MAERTKDGRFAVGHIGFNKNNGYGLSYFKRDKRWFIICRNKNKIPFARAIAEGYFKIKLSNNQVVHHINEIETDDRIENLMILTRSEHLSIHRKKVLGARKW